MTSKSKAEDLSRFEDKDPSSRPEGCRWCGRREIAHAYAYSHPIGYHNFIEPTEEQRVLRAG